MRSVIVALEDNTTLDIMIDKHLTSVRIPRGSMIIFDSASGHSGSPNNSEFENTRVHCKLKSPDLDVEHDAVVEYYTCKYKCGKHCKSKIALNDHHRNCRLSPNYEIRRKSLRKSDAKYQKRMKLEKEIDMKNSVGKKGTNQSNTVAVSIAENEAIQKLKSSIQSHNLTPNGDFDNAEEL